MSGHYALAAGESLCHQLESPESRAVPRRAGNAGLGGNLPAEPLPGTERLSRKGGQPIAPRVYFKDGHRGGRVTSPPLVPRACPLTCWWPRLPPSPRPCCMDVNPDPILPNRGPLLSPCLAPPVSGPMTGHTGTRGKHTQHLLSSQARPVTAIVTQWGRRFIPVLSPLNRVTDRVCFIHHRRPHTQHKPGRGGQVTREEWGARSYSSWTLGYLPVLAIGGSWRPHLTQRGQALSESAARDLMKCKVHL